MIDYFQRQTIVEQLQQEMGLDVSVIYCSTTGAPIGRLLDDELELVWDQLPETNDLEELTDELIARVVCSMRPSPSWNFIRTSTYKEMLKQRPAHLLAYLLGRYFRPRDNQYNYLKRNELERHREGLNQIALYNQTKTMDYSNSDVKLFIHGLIELDILVGLPKQPMFNFMAKTPLKLDLANSQELAKIANLLFKAVEDIRTNLIQKQRDAEELVQGNKTLRSTVRSSFLQLDKIPETKKTRKESKESLRKFFSKLYFEIETGRKQFDKPDPTPYLDAKSKLVAKDKRGVSYSFQFKAPVS